MARQTLCSSGSQLGAEAFPLTEDRPDPRGSLGDRRESGVAEYVDALQAALRVRQRLTDDALTVEVAPDGELPLVPRTLLR